MLKRVLVPAGAVLGVALLVLAFMPSGGKQTLVLSFQNLPPLENGFYYEGWAVIDGEPWTTGTFNVAPDGSLVDTEGSRVAGGEYDAGRDLSASTMVAITIHYPGDQRGPAAPHIVGGTVSDLSSQLTFTSPIGVGIDFSEAEGIYYFQNGALHLDVSMPRLPAGWRYEAWLTMDEAPWSFARFGGTDGEEGADGHDHGSGEGEVVDAELGHHLVNVNGVDARGRTLFVTFEPSPDDAQTPFSIRVLEAQVPSSAEDGVEYVMARVDSPLPIGQATIE